MNAKKMLHKANLQATTTDSSQKTLSPLDCVGGFPLLYFYICSIEAE